MGFMGILTRIFKVQNKYETEEKRKNEDKAKKKTPVLCKNNVEASFCTSDWPVPFKKLKLERWIISSRGISSSFRIQRS